LIKAIAHPLRHRILVALGEGVASPKDIAGRLEEPLGRVSHHFRVLVRLDAIELVDTRQRRGAVEHFYRAKLDLLVRDDAWAALPRAARRALFGQNLERILHDVRKAAEGGGFEHPRAHVSYTLLELDDAGLDEVADILAETVERLVAVRAASADRLAASPDAGTRTELALLHFDRG
jgi:DNA-binding transcriptional ArsR family regulator